MYSESSEIVVVAVEQQQRQLLRRPLHLDRHCRAVVVAADRPDVADTVDDDFVAVLLVTLTSILSYRLAMVLVALPLNLVYSLLRPAVHYFHCYSGIFPANKIENFGQNGNVLF